MIIRFLGQLALGLGVGRPDWIDVLLQPWVSRVLSVAIGIGLVLAIVVVPRWRITLLRLINAHPSIAALIMMLVLLFYGSVLTFLSEQVESRNILVIRERLCFR